MKKPSIKLLDLSMYMVSMMTYCFSVRGFGHPVSLKPHYGHPVMEILAKTLLPAQIYAFNKEFDDALYNSMEIKLDFEIYLKEICMICCHRLLFLLQIYFPRKCFYEEDLLKEKSTGVNIPSKGKVPSSDTSYS